jgi:hypothetical protein
MAKRAQPKKKKKVNEEYEPSFDKKYRDDALRAYHTVESMGERLGTIGEEEVAELMCGACDLHIHCWPDPLIDTGWSQSNIAKRATDEGLPSHDGAHHHRVMGEKGGIELLDKKGKPLKELMEILEIVKKYDLILDPCHASVKERFVVIDAARRMGIKKIMLTHPNWNVNRATIDQQVEMANRGAFVGLFMYSSVPHFNNPNGDPFEMLEIIKKVGPDRIVISTDLGTMLNVHPVEGLKLFFRLLLALGVKKTDIEKMAKKNSSYLLGL